MFSQRMIQLAINYECDEGIHTFHTCEYCGQNPARAERCVECWRALLHSIDRRVKDEDTGDCGDEVEGCSDGVLPMWMVVLLIALDFPKEIQTIPLRAFETWKDCQVERARILAEMNASYFKEEENFAVMCRPILNKKR